MFPETGGRTLEEVEAIFNQGQVFTAWRVDKNAGKRTLDDILDKDPKNLKFHDEKY